MRHFAPGRILTRREQGKSVLPVTLRFSRSRRSRLEIRIVYSSERFLRPLRNDTRPFSEDGSNPSDPEISGSKDSLEYNGGIPVTRRFEI